MKPTVLDPASDDGESPLRSTSTPAGGNAYSPSHRGLLRRAAEHASLAPSVHNTQPWRLAVTSSGVEIRADLGRRLEVVDPHSRQLLISCGCAVLNARVTIASGGFEPVVNRFPDSDRPELVAVVAAGRPVWPGRCADLERAIARRRTNRRPFALTSLPAAVVQDLALAARQERAGLLAITSDADRAAVLELTASASAAEHADPAYRAELSAWTTDDLRRHDGVQAANVPYRGRSAPHATLVRDFDTHGMGWLPASDGSDGGTLLLLWTADDDQHAWLRAGEALERAWLELTARGFWASPVGQPVEHADTHAQLRELLRLKGHPQLLLRVGLAPDTVPSRRRPLSDVITETDASWGGS